MNTGAPSRAPSSWRNGRSASGTLTDETTRPVSNSTTEGTPIPTALTLPGSDAPDELVQLIDQRSRARPVRRLDQRVPEPAVAQARGGHLRAAEVDADHFAHSCDAAAASSSTIASPTCPEHRSGHVWVRARNPGRSRAPSAAWRMPLRDPRGPGLRSFPTTHSRALHQHKRQSRSATDRGAALPRSSWINSDGSGGGSPRAFRASAMACSI